jgi:undecaprenyl-diphosphatase
MSEETELPRPTLEDALAARWEAWRRAPSAWTEALHELGSVDRAAYRAVASTPTPQLDGLFRRLSTAADRSKLWCGIAATMALVGGSSGRRAAVDGLVAIGTTSVAVNLGVKPLARRRRPLRAEPAAFESREVPMPGSTSFPSGHAASAFAFAVAVDRDLPQLAVPLGLLAGAVAYSRVHTGVHYPGDVAVGSILGASTAAMTGAWRPHRRRG